MMFLLRALLCLLALGGAALAQLATPTPAPTGFPTPSFATTSLTSWISTGGGYCSQDAFVSATYTACDDMSGFGNGFCQPSKPLQPSMGTNNGLYFSGSIYLKTCFWAVDLLARGPQFTLGFAFTLDAGFAGATNRQLFDFPQSAALHQLQVYVTNYTVVAYQRTAGAGTVHTITSGAISATAKHTAIVTGDISIGTMTLYVDGSLVGTTTWAGSATKFNVPPEIDLGNSIVGGYATPLTGELLGFPAHNTALSAGQVATLNTYLAGL